MARVVTTSTVPLRRQAWQDLPATLSQRSAVPRGEIRFWSGTIVIAPGDVADGQGVSFTCNLPQNFSYVLAEMHFSINETTEGDGLVWSPSAIGIIVNGAVAARTIGVPFELQSNGIGNVSGGRLGVCYSSDKLPKTILLQADNVSNVAVHVRAGSDAGGESACSGELFARFLQYDVDQTYDFAVNTPVLTR